MGGFHSLMSAINSCEQNFIKCHVKRLSNIYRGHSPIPPNTLRYTGELVNKKLRRVGSVTSALRSLCRFSEPLSFQIHNLHDIHMTTGSACHQDAVSQHADDE